MLSLAAFLAFATPSQAAPDSAAKAAHHAPTIPAWVFPPNTPSAGETAPPDRDTPLRVPGSPAIYTQAQVTNVFSPPDWFPASHSTMPTIVASGRKPAVLACGYCHTPGGQGRPENARLAGLPAPYIIQQLADFKSGARRSSSPDPYLPTDLMIDIAAHATPDEVSAAAAYFAEQRPIQRVRIVESDRVPRFRVAGFVYVAIPDGGDEPLGQRILEFTPDLARHEARDDRMQYVAYAPKGSLARGRSLALGATGLTACISCHGDQLQGVGLIPGIAGRSPTYLIRQLLGFHNGTRAGANAQPMAPVAAQLKIADMIDVVAYAASLPAASTHAE